MKKGIILISFQDKIAKMRYWPVEIFRTGIPAAAKGKKVCIRCQYLISGHYADTHAILHLSILFHLQIHRHTHTHTDTHWLHTGHFGKCGF